MKNEKFLFALLMSSTLVACGGTNPTEPSSEAKTENKTEEVKNSEAQPTEEVPVVEKEAKLVRSYTGTFVGGYYIPAYNMVQPGYDNYVITTFKDGTYRALNVKYMDMYGTIGNVSLRTEGQFTKSENEDGDLLITIGAAESILYTTCGMFNFQYSWQVNGFEDSLFPVQLMGSASNVDTLDLFKSEYGFEFSFLVGDTGAIVELNLPDYIASRYVVDQPSEGDTTETPAE